MHDGGRKLHSCHMSASNLACERTVQDQAAKALVNQDQETVREGTGVQ